jgi:signal recognition particle receptor subunit alpha
MDIGQGPRPDLRGESFANPSNCPSPLTNQCFKAVYQSLLHLTWVDKLLDNIRAIFVNVYKDQLKEVDMAARTYRFDPYFDQQMKELEASTGEAVTADPPRANVEVKKASSEEGDTGGPPPPPSPVLLKAQPQAAPQTGDSSFSTPIQSPDSSRPTTPIPGHLITAKGGPGGRGSRRSRKAATTSASASGDEARKVKPVRSSGKKARVWGPDGLADEDDGVNLDYGGEASGEDGLISPPIDSVAQETWGSKTKKGQFVLKDLDDEVAAILDHEKTDKSDKTASASGVIGSSLGVISGYFRNIVGGKTLTKQDLEKPMKAMEEHLIKKNVAREAAVRLCEGVEAEMLGKKTGTFENVDSALRPALEASLRRILTPTSSLDLLQEIESITSPASKQVVARPYVISIVGVNGVGKSTNLSMICYFLLQNNYRVLVAACDTFRSGAVEQLNVHVRNLKELSARENVGYVDLYQKGYGKDAANVAKDAVDYAAANKFDVVLIDTAGRRHNDTRLMSSLEKFAKFAKPDKILMVGEALVGTDSVMQARNFNAAFGSGRGLDGFIISKCDTVGDMIGTLVSMVHATGIPVLFLGTGQHYGDLRNLSVPWAVKLLMQS